MAGAALACKDAALRVLIVYLDWAWQFESARTVIAGVWPDYRRALAALAVGPTQIIGLALMGVAVLWILLRAPRSRPEWAGL